MKRSARHRVSRAKQELRRRIILASLVMCMGMFGVVCLVGGKGDVRDLVARAGGGGDSYIMGLGIGQIADARVHALAGSTSAAGGHGYGQQTALGAVDDIARAEERLLASADCSGQLDNTGIAILYVVGILYCFLGLAIVCDEFFQSSLEIISEVLELTPDVAGATFLAAGSSAPELFTSLADAFGDANSTGTGTIVGSAMFNILVIVALSAAVAGRGGASIDIDWRPVSRDVLFYTYSIVVLTLVFIDSDVQWWEGLIMTLSYVVYIVFMKYNSRILAHCQPPKIGITDDAQASNGDVAAAVAAVSGTKRPSQSGGSGEDTAKVSPLPQDPKPQEKEDEAASAAAAAAAAAAEGVAEAEGGGTDSATRKSSTLGIRNRVERKKSEGVSSSGEDRRDSAPEDKPLVLADENQATADEESGMAPAGVQAGADAGAGAEGVGTAGVVASDGTEKLKEEACAQEDEQEAESRFAWPDSRPDQVLWVLGLPLLIILSLTIPDSANPRFRKFYMVSFIMSLAWIGALTHYMVELANAVGCYGGVSPIFMGLVVLAIGTSVPDALGSMIAARSGEANMAIANAVGSNVFDILIGLGFPWFLRGLIVKEPMPVNRDGIALNVLILFCTALLFVAVLALNNWSMDTRTGIFLFSLYVLYVMMVVIRELILS